MPDNEQPTPSAEADHPTTVISQSGGVDIDAQRDVNIGGSVVGRDFIQTITNIFQGDTAQRDLRNRRNMLERVKNDWVKGVLEKSLYHEVMLDLGLEERPGEVQHPWDMMLQMPERENRTLPPGTKIIQVFDEMNHALLILGEPGSGKTTMLLELARDTIARAERDPTQLIPVVFNLSSWSADPKQSIANWLVKELRDKYNVHKKIAQPWIDNDDLLLLLDGLDEVKIGRREACVQAINEFRSEHGLTQMGVCSRIADYEALATQLKLRGALFIQPLTTQQINEYLERAGNELASVREALRHGTELRELAQSSLMLSIMSFAYTGQSVDYLPADTIQRRSHLFNAYVDKMFARTARTEYEPYSRGDTIRWLAWLAERMSEHGQTEFLIEQMQPSWLRSDVQRRMFSIGSMLASGLGWGLAVGLVAGLGWGLGSGLISGLWGWWVEQGKVEPVESFKLLRPKLVGGLLFGLTLTLIGELILGLIGGLAGWTIDRLALAMISFLLVGLLLGLLMGLVTGLGSEQIRTKTKPNQGIWLSGSNALFVGLLVGGLGGLVGSVVELLGKPSAGLSAGLSVGLMFVVFFWFYFGGLAFIRHFILRFILWRKGYIPCNYVRFLDFAADRIFLRKVGGGYIFIHRMLMEYFASLEPEPVAESPK